VHTETRKVFLRLGWFEAQDCENTNSPPDPVAKLEFRLRHSDRGPSVSLKTGLARKIQNDSVAHTDEVCLAEILTRPVVLGNFSERKRRRSGIELRQKGLQYRFSAYKRLIS